MAGTNLWRTAAAVVCVTLAAASCSPTTDDEARQSCTWTIGIMGPLGGEFVEFGGARARGVEIAVELANESGDLACTLDTHSEDTNADFKVAPASARRLVDDEDLVACVCGYSSRETTVTGDVFEQAGVALLSTSEESRMRDRGFDTWFRLVTPVDRQATATGVYIRRVFEPRSVAIVATVQSYSDDVVDHVRAALGRRFEGPVIPYNPETFPEDVASKIRRMSPELVFFAGYAPEAWEVFHGIRGLGLKLPFVTDGGAIGPTYGPKGRDLTAGPALLSCACTDLKKLEAAEAFVAEHRARYGGDPPLLAADGFDGANVVIDALRQLTGSESTEDVRAHVVEYLEEADGLEGLVKQYAWGDDGELVTDNGDVWMWEWTKRRGFRMLGSVAELIR